jgi:cell division protein FtsB
VTVQNATIVIAVAVSLSWVWGTVDTLQRNFAYQRQVDTLRENVELEKLRNENLKFEQKYYSSAEYLELSARQRLNVASPGEKVIILPDTKAITDTSPTTSVAKAQASSNLAQWLDFFLGSRSET